MLEIVQKERSSCNILNDEECSDEESNEKVLTGYATITHLTNGVWTLSTIDKMAHIGHGHTTARGPYAAY